MFSITLCLCCCVFFSHFVNLYLYIYLQGTFRLACEHVLKTLKKGRETLLTLLEAFVYDPLVDWAVAEDTLGTNDAATHRHRALTEQDRHNIGTVFGATEMAFGIETARKQMQDEFTRDTLIIQFTELKPDWLQNRSVFHVFVVHVFCIKIIIERIFNGSTERNQESY